VAATIGLNDTDISARARVQTQARHADQTEDHAGPFRRSDSTRPTCVSKRFYFDARAQYLRVRIDDIDGSLGITN